MWAPAETTASGAGGCQSAYTISVDITLEAVTVEQKPILWRLLQVYLHDLSEFDGQDPDPATGEYKYSYFDHYWDRSLYPPEPREPYFIHADDKLAGFAMVRHLDNGKTQMAEFTVLRKWRGTGLALEAAGMVFHRYPGPWDLTIHPKNERAKAFWVKAIESNAEGDWTERGGIIVWHQFDIPAPAEQA